MKALVLGGSRFIGLHLVQELVRQGHEVTTFSRGQTPVVLPESVKRLYGDRSDKDQMRSIFGSGDFDLVFETSGNIVEDPYDPEAYKAEMQVWMDCFHGKIKRFVYCSTVGVYARAGLGEITEESPLNRDPGAGSYTRNNVQAEDILMSAYRDHGFPVTIVRPTRVTGADNYRFAIEASYFTRILQGRKVIIPGDGNNKFQGIDVDDLAELFVAAGTTDRGLGEAYNAAGPDGISIKDYVAACGRITGMTPQVVRLEADVMAQLEKPLATLPWQQSAPCNMDKVKEHLNFIPKYGVVSALERAYEWYKTQDVGDMGFDFSYEEEVAERYG